MAAAESKPDPLPMSVVVFGVKLYSRGWASWYLAIKTLVSLLFHDISME